MAVLFACLAFAPGARASEGWFREGLAGQAVTALAVAPADPNRVYAGTAAGRVYRSEDAGGIWSPETSGLPGSAVRALAVDPFDPLRVFSGTDSGLYRSVDGGRTWAFSGAGLPPVVVALAVDPVDPARVWASTTEPGLLHVHASSDGGDRWSAVTIQGPAFSTPAFGWVVALAFRPGTSTLFACWHDVLFFTGDGARWDLYPDVQSEVAAVAPDPYDADRVFIGTLGRGVGVSSDNRAPWRFDGDLEETVVPALAADPLRSGAILAVSGDSVFESLDGGLAWAPLGDALPSPTVLAIGSDGSVRAGTYDGVRRYGVRPSSAPRADVETVPRGRAPVRIEPRDSRREGMIRPGVVGDEANVERSAAFLSVGDGHQR